MMKSEYGSARRAMFWAGSVALVLGVALHLPMFLALTAHGGMGHEMGNGEMMLGMALIMIGLALATYAVMPPLSEFRARRAREGQTGEIEVRIDDSARLTGAHYKLLAALIVAITIDVMKPATLGFVLPGMQTEYGMSRGIAGLLPFVALCGTAVGSVLAGLLADVAGRRATILVSALMFIGTSICGAMPNFTSNLLMCFLMGMSAGGLLPIVFTLMAETVPARHRGWILVLVGGLGTSAGYLAASGAATFLEPLYGWRVLWLMGLPTGLGLILLKGLLPESPRFLLQIGQRDEALAILARFGASASVREDSRGGGAAREAAAPTGTEGLFSGRYRPLSAGLTIAGVSWGLVNFGFLLWLPSNLRDLGLDPVTTDSLLAKSALFALPGCLVVAWLYHSWSAAKTLSLFIGLNAAVLVGFFVIAQQPEISGHLLSLLTILLLFAVSAVIAILIPYATEIYPVRLRATGAGLVAGSSKFGGILATVLAIGGLFSQMGLSAVLLALPLGGCALVIAIKGIETRGRSLEEIALQRTERRAYSGEAVDVVGVTAAGPSTSVDG